jgi:hypothetical protein
VIWLVGGGSLLLLVLVAIALVDLVRIRQTMKPWQMVIWALVIVLIPIGGLLAYVLWRIARSSAMTDAIEFGDEHGEGGLRDRKTQY